MSSRVNNDGGTLQLSIYRPSRSSVAKSTGESGAAPSSSSSGKAATSSGSSALAATASSYTSTEVHKLVRINNFNTSFYVDNRLNQRVVQLRDADSHKLVIQEPSSNSLNRMATLRSVAGEHLDVKA